MAFMDSLGRIPAIKNAMAMLSGIYGGMGQMPQR